MITSETLAAMVHEMLGIHKKAAATVSNPFYNQQVKMMKIPAYRNKGPGIAKSVENQQKKRRKIVNLNPLKPE